MLPAPLRRDWEMDLYDGILTQQQRPRTPVPSSASLEALPHPLSSTRSFNNSFSATPGPVDPPDSDRSTYSIGPTTHPNNPQQQHSTTPPPSSAQQRLFPLPARRHTRSVFFLPPPRTSPASHDPTSMSIFPPLFTTPRAQTEILFPTSQSDPTIHYQDRSPVKPQKHNERLWWLRPLSAAMVDPIARAETLDRSDLMEDEVGMRTRIRNQEASERVFGEEQVKRRRAKQEPAARKIHALHQLYSLELSEGVLRRQLMVRLQAQLGALCRGGLRAIEDESSKHADILISKALPALVAEENGPMAEELHWPSQTYPCLCTFASKRRGSFSRHFHRSLLSSLFQKATAATRAQNRLRVSFDNAANSSDHITPPPVAAPKNWSFNDEWLRHRTPKAHQDVELPSASPQGELSF